MNYLQYLNILMNMIILHQDNYMVLYAIKKCLNIYFILYFLNLNILNLLNDVLGKLIEMHLVHK